MKKIKGRTLEFDEETHTYLVDGVIVPSVTQILSKQFPNKYSDIPKDVLKKAAERGTAIHKSIEDYCNGKGDLEDRCVKNYRWLEKIYKFESVENELPIILDIGGKTYAGRLDLILKINGVYAVADIKTTATLDKEYLGYQLNLYRLGVMQSYNYQIEKLYGIHLREDTRKLTEIPVKGEEWLLKSLNLMETE